MDEDKIENIVKQKSNYRCAMCHKETERCYILENEKGLTEDNMIALCYFCAQKYLGNPDIIKQIKQKRDYWYEQIEKSRKSGMEADLLQEEEITSDKLNRHTIAIYHVVYEYEGLEESAKTIHELVYSAQEKQPDYARALYLDIDGHIDEHGGFDKEMMELQQEFLMKTMLPYFQEIHMPILDIKNSNPQKNNIPPKMEFIQNEADLIQYILNEIKEGGYIIEKIKKDYGTNSEVLLYKTTNK